MMNREEQLLRFSRAQPYCPQLESPPFHLERSLLDHVAATRSIPALLEEAFKPASRHGEQPVDPEQLALPILEVLRNPNAHESLVSRGESGAIAYRAMASAVKQHGTVDSLPDEPAATNFLRVLTERLAQTLGFANFIERVLVSPSQCVERQKSTLTDISDAAVLAQRSPAIVAHETLHWLYWIALQEWTFSELKGAFRVFIGSIRALKHRRRESRTPRPAMPEGALSNANPNGYGSSRSRLVLGGLGCNSPCFSHT